MSELSNLALFVRVAEEGSFSAAARFFGIMPSSVSRQISQLEAELDTRLFYRTTRQQNLTEAGKIYLQHAKRIISDLETAKLAVSQLVKTPSGCLNVSIEADFANTYIAPILPQFMQLHPEIQIKFVMNTKIVDLIDSGIDIAIRIGELDDSSLFARKIALYRTVVCASPSYISKNGNPNHPYELTTHNCLSFKVQHKKDYWGFMIDGEAKNIEITGSVDANNLVFLKNAALNNLGIVNLPIWMVKDEIAEQKLVPLLEDYQMSPSNIPIHAVFAHSKHLAPKIRTFIDYLIDKMANSALLER